jgi:CheY-like chemotaxis protein
MHDAIRAEVVRQSRPLLAPYTTYSDTICSMSLSLDARTGRMQVLWLNAGLSCDGESVSITAATQPSIEDIVLGALPGLPKVVNQRVVKGLIEKKGHSGTLVNNGLEALDAVQSSRFDLILMDVQMPVMDGLSAASAIRSFEELRTRPRIPILGLTAHASNADRERCLAAGMNDHVAKPFRPNELVDLIEPLTRGPHDEPAS